jgi:pimeloyl-ACP methyl ester carboxylesterase
LFDSQYDSNGSSDMIKKFEVKIEQKILDDLKNRIRLTRWPDEITGSEWNHGASLKFMKELTAYWENQFDWRKTEREINSYNNFLCEVDGYSIHFMHVKGRSRKSIPLLITHGWPGSFLEMMKLIPLLTENSELTFDLIIPSMPGFGFSDKVAQSGCNVFFMADLFYKLMQELGYRNFGVQGGDFGAGVSSSLAYKYPEAVIGMHLNYIPGNYHPVLDQGEELAPVEKEFLRSEEEWYSREGGYSLQQKTKPLTLAYGLNDSPVGLCAWIVEKMYGWAECDGKIENVFTKDELLSNVTLYWVTETLHSSIRLYNENSKAPLKIDKNGIISVPAGIARFRFEEPFPPRRYVERGFNIRRWTEFSEGGHFAAMEKPELLAKDIIDFFSELNFE